MAEGVLCGESGSGDLPPKRYILGLMSPRTGHKREFQFAAKVQLELIGSLGQCRGHVKEAEVTPAAGADNESNQEAMTDPSSSSMDVTPVPAVPLEKISDATKVIDVENEEDAEMSGKSNVLRQWVSLRRFTRSELKRLNGGLETPGVKELENHSSVRPVDRALIELKSRASEPILFFKRRRLDDISNSSNGEPEGDGIAEKKIPDCDYETKKLKIDSEEDPSSVLVERVGTVNSASIESAEGLKLKTNAEEDPSSLLVERVGPGNSASVESAEGLEVKELGSRMADGSSSEVAFPRDQEVSGSSTGDVDHDNLQDSTKKLELKMSKKVSLTKFPTTIKDLFATGFLNGCKVRYLRRVSGKEELHGVIKDGMILCFCSSCKGEQTVTPSQFELHAGSLNKRAIDYIYLENGRSVRDVLRSCFGTPLEMFEERLQTEISLAETSKPVTCERCRGSVDVTSYGKSRQICKKCLESQQSSAQRTHSARLPQNNNMEVRDRIQCNSPHKLKLSRSPVTPKASSATSMYKVLKNKSAPGKLTRKDLGLHKLVFMSKGLPDGTEVAYYARGQRLLQGYKQGFNIFCYCCNTEVSPSQFEAHAGWASRRKPYLHIYTSDGVSLHELAISLTKGRKKSVSENDDLCTICGDGGDLLLCDGCPRAFHTECVDLACIPRGNWYCSYCQRNFEDERAAANSQNALAAGRVPGMEALETMHNRCTRVVKKPQVDIGGGCVLCRGHDFSKSGFGPRTVMLCDQCEQEFHVGCLRDHGLANLKELPKEKWFCCTDCNRINISLEKLVLRGAEKLPPSLSNAIKKRLEEKGLDGDVDPDISWRLLSGKNASPDSRLLLSKAVAIFQDRFDPIVDVVTGRDLIPPMVYGRNIRGQEFGGIYCAVLTVNSTVVSAGVLRIFGKEVAELPLVATTSGNQGKGYFQSLFSCIERFLGFLEVKNLVLPAADEAESIWTKKFGFSKMSQEEVSNYTRDIQMMTFQGTSMLKKSVPRCRLVTRPPNAPPADAS